MSDFDRPVTSVPGHERVARTPFGSRVVIHATSAETNGAFGMWETFTPPGKGPGLHMHTRETEAFRVISGTYKFWCGAVEIDAPPGTVVVLPPNVPHRFQNVGDTPGQMMAIVTPGGAEALFMEIEATGADTPEKVAMIEARLGIANDDTRRMGLT